ncbi:MAG: lamin tail domain-containing protein [Bacteroidia bacterium]
MYTIMGALSRLAGYFLVMGAMVLHGCQSRDVYPVANLVLNQPGLGTDSSEVRIVLKINGPTNRTLVIPVVFGGNAQLDKHYRSTGTAFEIPAGQDSGVLVLQSTGVDNNDSLGIELSIVPAEGVILGPVSSIVIALVDAQRDADNDGTPDIYDRCPNEPGPADNQGCPWPGLILNEVLYDPPADLAGDANQDGLRDPLADEFAEFYNDGPALDISGYSLWDATSMRHSFPAGTIIPSRGVLVVFGGGNPTGPFGGANVQTASSGQLNLNNAGDFLILKNASGAELLRFDVSLYSGDPNQSYTRSPDLTGTFILHSVIPSAMGSLFSPGLRLNGTTF